MACRVVEGACLDEEVDDGGVPLGVGCGEGLQYLSQAQAGCPEWEAVFGGVDELAPRVAGAEGVRRLPGARDPE